MSYQNNNQNYNRRNQNRHQDNEVEFGEVERNKNVKFGNVSRDNDIEFGEVNRNKNVKLGKVDRNKDVEIGEVVDVERKKTKRTSEWVDNKYYYAFAYFLFFLPFFVDDSRRSRFYANQGLMVWLWLFIGNIIIYYIGFINVVAPYVVYIHWTFSIIIALLALGGFIATVQDKKDVRLPVIGMVDIIKE